MSKLPAEEIIRKLQSPNTRDNEEALVEVYEHLQPLVARFILKKGGNEQDVEDVFHDGLIAFYKLAKRGKLRNDLNVIAYVFSICRNMWFKKLKKSPHNLELDDRSLVIPVEEIRVQTLLSEERSALLEKILDQLGDECKKIIRMFYYDRMRMKEIASALDLSSEQMAKNKKMHCMNKLRAIVMASPFIQDLLR